MASNPGELERRTAVDPDDEPSVEWGWHGHFHRGKIIAGVLAVLLLVVFNIGPYQSHTQVLWLSGVVLALLFMIWRSAASKRNAWRR